MFFFFEEYEMLQELKLDNHNVYQGKDHHMLSKCYMNSVLMNHR